MNSSVLRTCAMHLDRQFCLKNSGPKFTNDLMAILRQF